MKSPPITLTTPYGRADHPSSASDACHSVAEKEPGPAVGELLGSSEPSQKGILSRSPCRPLYNDHTLDSPAGDEELLDDARTARFEAVRWHERFGGDASYPNPAGQRVRSGQVGRVAGSELRHRRRPEE
jgi:hypothetical protein